MLVSIEYKHCLEKKCMVFEREMLHADLMVIAIFSSFFFAILRLLRRYLPLVSHMVPMRLETIFGQVEIFSLLLWIHFIIVKILCQGILL